MMRWVVVLVLTFAGCVATLPSDDASITADLAVETAREMLRLRHEVAPTPVPPSGVCGNCDGRGYVGDGNGIKVPCQPCRGTGKR